MNARAGAAHPAGAAAVEPRGGRPRVLVVIVNYRSADCAIDCLRTLAPEVERVGGARAVIVENGSGDGSAERLADALLGQGWSRWASLLRVAENRGYAAGNNAALRTALAATGDERPDLVWLLNPDTLVRPGALEELIAFLTAHPEVGIAGSRLEYEDGTQHASRYRFPSVWSELDAGLRLGLVSRLLRRWQVDVPLSLDEHPIDWVAGASMIVRREVFERIGLLDEEYFLYFEEVDFCRRAQLAGFPCWYVPASRVAHLVGRSSGLTNLREPPRRRPRYWFESRRRYFDRQHGRVYRIAADVAFAVGFGLFRLRSRLQRKPDLDPPHLWGDFVRFSFLGGLR